MSCATCSIRSSAAARRAARETPAPPLGAGAPARRLAVAGEIPDTVPVTYDGAHADSGRAPVPDDVSPSRDGRATTATPRRRLGFFTRLLDLAEPAERYRLATAQI